MTDSLLQDLRYAIRAMLNSSRFTSVAILFLRLGIGKNTSILSVENTLLLKPLPYKTLNVLDFSKANIDS